MKTASIKSLKIVEAVELFKKTYFSESGEYCISTSRESKRDKDDKGFYSLSFCDPNCNLEEGNIPDFLEKENYTEDAKQFFEAKLNKVIRFLEVSWTYSKSKGFDMAIHLRF